MKKVLAIIILLCTLCLSSCMPMRVTGIENYGKYAICVGDWETDFFPEIDKNIMSNFKYSYNAWCAWDCAHEIYLEFTIEDEEEFSKFINDTKIKVFQKYEEAIVQKFRFDESYTEVVIEDNIYAAPPATINKAYVRKFMYNEDTNSLIFVNLYVIDNWGCKNSEYMKRFNIEPKTVTQSENICYYLSEYRKPNEVIFLVSSQYVKSDFACFNLENDSSLDYRIISCEDKILYYNFDEFVDGKYQVYSVDYYGNNKEFCFKTPYHIVGTFKDFYLVYENNEYFLLDRETISPVDELFENHILSKRIENDNIYIKILGNPNEFVINRELLINKSNIGDFLKKYNFNINVSKAEDNIIFIECTVKNKLYDKAFLLFEYDVNNDSITFIDCCTYGMDGIEYFFVK